MVPVVMKTRLESGHSYYQILIVKDLQPIVKELLDHG